MATTERTEAQGRRRIAWFTLVSVATAGIVVALIAYFNRPPQMGADEDVFNTVDALYTAVRLKDEAKLAQCEQRLHASRDGGKLPASAAEHLDDIIATARKGKWESAAESLYDFMLAQRREGQIEQRPHNAKVKK